MVYFNRANRFGVLDAERISNMRKIPAGNVTTLGVDVSHHNGQIDWAKVKDGGVKFAVAKATEYRPDLTFLQNKNGAKACGMIFGAYHFFHPSKDAIDQAKEFYMRAGLCDFYVLDWESTDNVPSAADRGAARLWLEQVEKITGKVPVIYGSPYFLEDLSLDASFARFPLWIAHYQTKAPLVPDPWKNWAFWQYTETGHQSGIQGSQVDCDVFNGSIVDLKKMVGL